MKIHEIAVYTATRVDYTPRREFKIHNHERDGRCGNNYAADGGDMYDLG